MINEIITPILYWLKHILRVLGYSMDFMLWNLFLALIPLCLSLWLFRGREKNGFFWWIGVVTFIIFLPNAPYVLTDIIHLINFIRYGLSSPWIIALVLIPQYTIFMFSGFQAYVVSLINLESYLEKRQLDQYIFPLEILIHILSAIGIYLGRFHRFNSWDFLLQPKFLFRSVIETFFSQQSILVMGITFTLLVILYQAFKEINLGLYIRIQERFKS
jgi:uncharacterized membrane protein